VRKGLSILTWRFSENLRVSFATTKITGVSCGRPLPIFAGGCDLILVPGEAYRQDGLERIPELFSEGGKHPEVPAGSRSM